jgi:hypothetical protein
VRLVGGLLAQRMPLLARSAINSGVPNALMLTWAVVLNTEYTIMKHLLIGTVAVAVLAISGPVLAQPATSMAPSGTNATAPAASTGHTGSVTRAHHRRHAVHSARNNSSGSGSSANQLNRGELEKFQATNPSSMNRMPAGGRPTSGNTTQ